MRTLFLLVGLLLAAAACKTTQPPAQPDPEPTPDPPAEVDSIPEYSIPEIQGSTNRSEFVGERVATTGTVTGVFPDLSGFFIQDPLGDDDEATSDGIFIVGSDTLPMPAVGEEVAVIGTVVEQGDRTQITPDSSLIITGTGTVPDPVGITVPTQWERYEGMLITIDQELTVISNFNLGRFGELELAPSLQYSPSQILDANDDPASGTTYLGYEEADTIFALDELQEASLVVLDDGSTQTNQYPPPYGSYQSPATVGSTVTRLVGIVDEAFDRYAVEPTEAVTIDTKPVPQLSPAPAETNLSVATLNVENYINGNGDGTGFSGFGPADFNEWERQTLKLVETLRGLSADIIALQEVERDGTEETSSIIQLVAVLNDSLGSEEYQVIADPVNTVNTGSIRNVILYRTAAVTPIGEATADPDRVHFRPPLTQLFQLNANGAQLLVSTVHHRSKSCSNTTEENRDQGQGCHNATRREQSAAAYYYVQNLQDSLGVANAIILGDFNAYSQEDPIDRLRAEGWITALPDSAYTYIFRGRVGSLDHIMLSGALAPMLLAAEPWNINAGLPSFLDYGTEFNPAEGFLPNAWRSSDHDPLVAHLNVSPTMNRFYPTTQAQPAIELSLYPNPATTEALVKWSGTEGNLHLSVMDARGRVFWHKELPDTRRETTLSVSELAPGAYWLVLESAQGRTTRPLVVE